MHTSTHIRSRISTTSPDASLRIRYMYAQLIIYGCGYVLLYMLYNNITGCIAAHTHASIEESLAACLMMMFTTIFARD